jgi:acyl dehydratase
VPGRWFEEFHEGDVIPHSQTVTVTQDDNAAFCAMTLNTQPLHLDRDAAIDAGFQDILVNGIYTFAAAVGVSVPDLTEGTLVANLGYDEVRHPAPVYPGDKLSVVSMVVATRPSSKPGRGIVTISTTATNQDGVEVCTFQRAAIIRTHPGGAS